MILLAPIFVLNGGSIHVNKKVQMILVKFGYPRIKSEFSREYHLEKGAGALSRWLHMKKCLSWSCSYRRNLQLCFWGHFDLTYYTTSRCLKIRVQVYVWWFRLEVEDEAIDPWRWSHMEKCPTRKLCVLSRRATLLLGSFGSDIPCIL